MASSLLKLNPDKTKFSIFGSHAQLKKLDPYCKVRIFGNSILPAVVVKSLRVWFDANFSFAGYVNNICKTCFIQMHNLRWVRQYLTDEAAILMGNALVSSRLITATLSSEVCIVSTCGNCSVFKIHLIRWLNL